MKRMTFKVTLVSILFLLLPSLPAHSAFITDSTAEMPRGTEFQLRYELDIPANRDFLVLGSSGLTGFLTR